MSEVRYSTAGWRSDELGRVMAALRDRAVPHRMEYGALVVPAELRRVVDTIVAENVGTVGGLAGTMRDQPPFPPPPSQALPPHPPPPPATAETRNGRRGWIWVAGILLAVVVVSTVVILATRADDGDDESTPTTDSVASSPTSSSVASSPTTDSDGALDATRLEFVKAAEEFIGDADGDVATQMGITFTDVHCEPPATTSIGTTYECSAVGSNGLSYRFTNEIDGERSFQVVDVVEGP